MNIRHLVKTGTWIAEDEIPRHDPALLPTFAHSAHSADDVVGRAARRVGRLVSQTLVVVDVAVVRRRHAQCVSVAVAADRFRKTFANVVRLEVLFA